MASDNPPSSDNTGDLETQSPLNPAENWQPVYPTLRLSRWESRALIFFGIAILGLLLVTRFLTPSSTGMGTHQRLGIPACGSMALFGFPCPSCGMTTSWAWLTRGQLQHSWNANPGGLALGFFVLIMGPWMLFSGIKGRWWPINCQPMYVLGAGLSIIALTIIQWVIRVWF